MQQVWLAHAAAGERAPGDRVDVGLGVGKAAAAATLAAELAAVPAARRPSVLVLYGVGGALPARAPEVPLGVGELCVVVEDVLADDGRQEVGRFVDLAGLGFGEVRFAMDRARSARAARLLGVRTVGGATVSACSATDAAAAQIAARTGALVESMEGAAVALVCARFGVGLVQLRAVANRTGDRYAEGADFAGAIAWLHAGLARLVEAGIA